MSLSLVGAIVDSAMFLSRETGRYGGTILSLSEAGPRTDHEVCATFRSEQASLLKAQVPKP
jgi:hypothetical protein